MFLFYYTSVNIPVLNNGQITVYDKFMLDTMKFYKVHILFLSNGLVKKKSSTNVQLHIVQLYNCDLCLYC